MFDLFKYLPVIMQAFNLVGKVRSALSTGTSVITVLKQDGPAVLEIVEQIGKTFWPTLTTPEDQVQAAAMKVFDQDYVKGVQANLNKVMASGLVVDGDYGEKTKAAVTAFQTKFKVDPADGWAGVLTNAALLAEVNKVGK